MANSIEELLTPAFIVDLQKVQRNANVMIDRFKKLGVQLRPHMKTHKTIECGHIMTGGTRRCIVVSTLAEAFFFANHGFDDILYAFSLSLDKIDKCAELSERLDLFHVLFDNMTVLEALKKKPLKEGKLWRVWLKLDCENGRAGVLHTEAAAVDLAKAISESSGIELSGVYAHCGNTYKCSGAQEIQAVAQRTISAVLSFGEKLKSAGISCPKFTTGSTPSCSLPVEDMGLLNEVHPGNYIFYDQENQETYKDSWDLPTQPLKCKSKCIVIVISREATPSPHLLIGIIWRVTLKEESTENTASVLYLHEM
ncbi:D-threo-3-hydroxyaspartate dehydratase isoform X2 [Polypterus senegalus]|uniref:D-threo-3-hydroxyaspartate dehydratase isoform X2 n=1 Tax=Polypterus senegalus TaxID=55291 RepID=UPI0019623DE8|nr:D-threo-3-hydroxyaspartate dehydratase isoform X2 [Polypterus senegalus]